MSDTRGMHFRRLRVRLETELHVIEGTLQLPSEGYRSRMTDFLNAHDSDFLPVTDATVRPRHGGEEHHGYLAVSVRHLVLGVARHVRRRGRAAVRSAPPRLDATATHGVKP